MGNLTCIWAELRSTFTFTRSIGIPLPEKRTTMYLGLSSTPPVLQDFFFFPSCRIAFSYPYSPTSPNHTVPRSIRAPHAIQQPFPFPPSHVYRIPKHPPPLPLPKKHLSTTIPFPFPLP
ncbi:hypothetical protein COCSADRAFT_41586 [Bipolaris sorokiniana ND90Pr]|uniref:Uncharacterized protein n=1 Tax=Cochliobolus sativus (strain ND90Pr / ATCC 201652) TaxID=665912 RepID=M2SQK5_COCSN|nr:uncharacterized protein COCSADRAFT_41586 [Bipolaris sorokiniana ND90Pr]EMD59032.1 hypothetical protein COCSADRAFT_41586 [Bipolaris sorokiniana ND90Pr]